MYSPTFPDPIPLDELGWANATYLGNGNPVCDPMMVWGTTIDVEPLELFLAEQRGTTVWPWQQELNGAGAFVNYLGFAGAPPMHSYKPSGLPMNSISVSVTMGPSESRPAVVDNVLVIRKQASLFIRADHRLVNAFAVAAFINTLRSYLANPWTLVQETDPTRNETSLTIA